MLKKSVYESNTKIFNIDIDSLLSSEFLEDEKNCDLSPIDFENPTKKLKINNSLELKNSQKAEQKTNSGKFSKKTNKSEEVSKFFESVGNDFSKSMQIKKNRLSQFTKKISSIYEVRVNQIIKRQQREFEKFKSETANNIKEEFSKFENEFCKIRQQESKLTKIWEQQIKLIYKLSEVQQQWIERLSVTHGNILQEFEKIREKQRNEILELTKSINQEIADFQQNFLEELKNDELQTIKKHLSNFYA